MRGTLTLANAPTPHPHLLTLVNPASVIFTAAERDGMKEGGFGALVSGFTSKAPCFTSKTLFTTETIAGTEANQSYLCVTTLVPFSLPPLPLSISFSFPQYSSPPSPSIPPPQARCVSNRMTAQLVAMGDATTPKTWVTGFTLIL